MALYCKVDCMLDSHPKIRKAGRLGREVFLFILRRHRAIDGRGSMSIENIDSEYLADQLMMTCNDAVTGVTACVTSKLITVTASEVDIIGWDDEWAREPASSAERVAKHRKNKRLADDVTKCNVTDVSSNESNVREEKRREEKKREEEGRNRELALAPSAVADTKKAKAKTPSREIAAVLAVLSHHSGVVYRGARAHQMLIAARLREGYTLDTLRKIPAYCAIEKGWRDDPKMAEFLRPETLYGATTIAKYADAANAWYLANHGDTPLRSIAEVLGETQPTHEVIQ